MTTNYNPKILDSNYIEQINSLNEQYTLIDILNNFNILLDNDKILDCLYRLCLIDMNTQLITKLKNNEIIDSINTNYSKIKLYYNVFYKYINFINNNYISDLSLIKINQLTFLISSNKLQRIIYNYLKDKDFIEEFDKLLIHIFQNKYKKEIEQIKNIYNYIVKIKYCINKYNLPYYNSYFNNIDQMLNNGTIFNFIKNDDNFNSIFLDKYIFGNDNFLTIIDDDKIIFREKINLTEEELNKINIESLTLFYKNESILYQNNNDILNNIEF